MEAVGALQTSKYSIVNNNMPTQKLDLCILQGACEYTNWLAYTYRSFNY